MSTPDTKEAFLRCIPCAAFTKHDYRATRDVFTDLAPKMLVYKELIFACRSCNSERRWGTQA